MPPEDGKDETEPLRRELQGVVNALEGSREDLLQRYPEVWNTIELQRDFTVKTFLAPFVSVTRKSDGKQGTLVFQHTPRFYFDFREDPR